MIKLTARSFVAGAAGTTGAVVALTLLSAGMVVLTQKAARAALRDLLAEMREAAGQTPRPTMTIDLDGPITAAEGFGPKLATKGRRPRRAQSDTPERET